MRAHFSELGPVHRFFIDLFIIAVMWLLLMLFYYITIVILYAIVFAWLILNVLPHNTQMLTLKDFAAIHHMRNSWRWAGFWRF